MTALDHYKTTAAIRANSLANHLNRPQDSSKAIEMAVPYRFQGWIGLDKGSAEGKMVWQEFEPKPWSEDDVDIKVTHCGICGSDIHTLRSGWGTSLYPCCVGHEVVGIAVKVGSNVKHIRTGDRCGVGAQSGSCLEPDCYECSSGLESYCPKFIPTYNGKFKDGSKSYGGYSDYVRTMGHYVVQIPDELNSAEAAPMLCGGITVWNPLVENGAGPSKRVGIVGIGGLGHFGLLWAAALGCKEVVAISRSSAKKTDALKMGATGFIATDEDGNWHKANARSLDLIISTVSSPNMPLSRYLQLLSTKGQFIQVGAPEDRIPAFHAFSLIQKGCKIGGSSIGSPKEISNMLNFAAKNNVHPFIEERPMKDANKAIIEMEDGNARYRYVLVNEAHVRELSI